MVVASVESGRYPVHMRTTTLVAGFAALAASGAPAFAQFDAPTATTWASRLVGQVASENGAPTIDSGDEIAAVFGGKVIDQPAPAEMTHQ